MGSLTGRRPGRRSTIISDQLHVSPFGFDENVPDKDLAVQIQKKHNVITHVRRRRRRAKGTNRLCISDSTKVDFSMTQLLCAWIVISALIIFWVVLRTFVSSRLSKPNSFEREYRASFVAVQKFASLYYESYTLAVERKRPPDQIDWPQYNTNDYQLDFSYGSNVKNCSLTIAMLDDKLGRPQYDYGPGQSIWFVLESVGAFAPPDSCVVLVASDCAMKEYISESTTTTSKTENDNMRGQKAYKKITEGIYMQSLPLFRKMIEAGRVRVLLLGHDKYQIPKCSDFTTSNRALLHRSFWEDEFDEKDSDQVLLVDRYSALCYPLMMDRVAGYAMVGSVPPKTFNPLDPNFLEGPCREMPKSWHSWLRPQRRKRGAIKGSIMQEKYPPICEAGRAPLGGGGLSLRSRKWMMLAIDSCPHVTYSGMDLDDTGRFFSCKVFDQVDEDYYFATILQGIGAPLPTAYAATTFVAEALWPDEVADIYRPTPEQKLLDLSSSRERPTIISIEGDLEIVIPNAVHKVWWYRPDEMVRSDILADSCPYLPFIYSSTMNRYEEFIHQSETWVGVGT